MKNLDWLFEVAPPFREAVCQAAADWLGSTSLNFAGAWLMEQHKYEHHDSDYEDLTGQHLDGPCVVPDRERQVDRITDMVNARWDELHDSREKLEADVDAALYGASMADDGYIPLEMAIGWLDRQAAITERDVRTYLNREDSALIQRKIDGLQSRLETARETAEKYRADSVAAQADADTWRAKCGALLDAAHEMIRIGGDA